MIHAVCGENGAGKSTLLKIVAGMIVSDSGHVEAFGSRLEPHTPREGIRRGIGMVLQHFALVPVFTALENIVLGAEPVSALGGSIGVLDLGAARKKALAVAKELGVELPLDAPVESLGVGDRQRLEIARALYRDAKLLVLDEPTAVLTKGEAKALYGALRRLADAGTGVVVVTHKMDEVREYADVVTVMRRGEVVFTRTLARGENSGEGKTLDAQVEEVTAAIMGSGRAGATSITGTSEASSTTSTSTSTSTSERDVVLRLNKVSLGRALSEVSLTVHAGEIVGIAGVEGNGQRELVALIARDTTPDSGSMEGGGAAIIREDRQSEGLVLDASLRDNIVLGELASFVRLAGWLDLDALETGAALRLERSGAPNDLDRSARTLSGGNQQKIVIARALARLGTSSHLLVAAQPTRGVDLGASSDIHERLRTAARSGAGVLILSSDLDELRALCSRILVLARGRIVADLPPTTSDEELGRGMLGLGEHGHTSQAGHAS
jgi:simple sugar transport system ATP-binding protein